MTEPEQEIEAEPASKVLATRVHEVRDRRGLSLRDLAKLLDEECGYKLSASQLSKIETGERKPSIDDLLAIAAALNVAPLSLILPRRVRPNIAIGRNIVNPLICRIWLRGELPLLRAEEVEAFDLDESWEAWPEYWRESLNDAETQAVMRAPGILTLRYLLTRLFTTMGVLEVTKDNLRHMPTGTDNAATLAPMRKRLGVLLNQLSERIAEIRADLEDETDAAR
jgi:transcriptional regulator with XRE-family HTH domain